jgi:hypothetical protein
VFTAAPTLTGVDHGTFTELRVAAHTSWPPIVPARFDEKTISSAAEILLDAIARSDGTRRSVLDEVKRTVVENGILGNIAWNARGDLLDAPFTILRVHDGTFVTDRVIVVRAAKTDQ